MIEYDLLQKYKSSGAVVDTNLLLLVVVGDYDVNRVSTFKKTIKYTASDYLLMRALMKRFDKIIATPNIFTEVDNLSRQISEHEHQAIASSLKNICAGIDEIYMPSAPILINPLHPKVGLTDMTILELASSGLLIITDDFPLYQRISGMNLDAININHIRKFN